MKPYLRGIHATLDSWRLDRDKDGWKMPKKKHKANKDNEAQTSKLSEDFHEDEDDGADWCDKWPNLHYLKHMQEADNEDEGIRAPQWVRAVP